MDVVSVSDIVCVVGLGYIGLPTAAALTQAGQHVIGVDVNERAVELINAGKLPFVEAGLEEVLISSIASGRFSATTKTPHAQSYLVAVPTPFKADNSADLSYVESATRSIARVLKGGELVVLESTSPPGTTEKMQEWVADERPDLDIDSVHFAHCPERVLPGRVMIELVENDRVIGGLTPDAAQMAADVYRTFCQGRLLMTDARTAELCKLVENSYRDVNIAFANELSRVCDSLNVNVWELIELANHHPRVNILTPGTGVGGHCIAVDPWFIVDAAPDAAKLIKLARQVNDDKPHRVAAQIRDAVAGVREPRIALLGLAFKANIDDLRESPAVEVALSVARMIPGACLDVVEPHVERLPASLSALDNINLRTIDEVDDGYDVVAILVSHDAFRVIRDGRFAETTVIDPVGLLHMSPFAV